jgi:hypothetical protein
VKQKRVERAERRRTLVELNLLSDARARPSARRRRGCLPFLTTGLLAMAALAAHSLGLL